MKSKILGVTAGVNWKWHLDCAVGRFISCLKVFAVRRTGINALIIRVVFTVFNTKLVQVFITDHHKLVVHF